MELQRSRLFLIIALFVLGIALVGEWQREHNQPLPTSETVEQMREEAKKGDLDIPLPADNTISPAPVHTTLPTNSSASLINVQTDVLKVKIDPLGGDIVRAELIKYPETIQDPHKGYLLLDNTATRNYIAQSGLIGKDELGPDSRSLGRAQYQVQQQNYTLTSTEPLMVSLFWKNDKGVEVTKVFKFKPHSYDVDVSYNIKNPTDTVWQGNFYGQLKRTPSQKKSGNFFTGIQVYEGAAITTPDKPYKKLSFSDMEKKSFKESIKGGWVAFQEHYFLSAWVPQPDLINHYYTRVDDEHKFFNVGATTSVEVPAKTEHTIQGQFYIGPELADTLKTVAPGLNLTVDYGILWPISLFLFWLLKNINFYVGNWGFSIILVTLIIKVAFYKLSATSYRSMGRMRNLQPKIEALKQKFGEDKQKFSVALMELYKKEKINPLGGCLPIIIQIPVFIALYYMLLESIELRHAPFILWIKDLSSQDPYYVLPLIMGATMFLQQRMNPAPPDPIQAKMMMLMPVVFTALFISFPSGLVLYWTVNNILSMAQQWFINRNLGNR